MELSVLREFSIMGGCQLKLQLCTIVTQLSTTVCKKQGQKCQRI